MKIRQKAFSLMKKWCDTLLTYTVEIDSPYLSGALLCPCCGIIHGRNSDLSLPLTLLYKETGDEKYMSAAKRLVDWTEYNLVCDGGLYKNDNINAWKGISSFAAITLGETVMRFRDVLDEKTAADWERIFLRLTDALVLYYESDSFKPVINYCAAAAALFALAYRLTDDEKYLAPALKWEAYCRGCFTENGILSGEGKPHFIPSEKGCYPIDMGYNLEESVPLLIMHSHFLSDREKLDFYRARTLDHLEFLLPDGAIDNTFGTRHNKWTYYGSRTSDGMAEGLVYLAHDPVIARAVYENVYLMERCTSMDLLGPGPMAKSAGQPSCIHHSFTHAKALAILYLDMNESDFDNCRTAVLPRENEGVKSYQGKNLYTVTRGNFIASINASDKAPSGFENGGGTLTMLYHKDYGAILAATTHSYSLAEVTNMQFERSSCISPCQSARLTLDSGYSSDTDNGVTLSRNGYTIEAIGKAPAFSIKYCFEPDSVCIRILSDNDCKFILPIVSDKTDKIEMIENGALFKGILSVTSDSGFTLAPLKEDERYWHPVGAHLYKQMIFSVEADKEAVIEISVK